MISTTNTTKASMRSPRAAGTVLTILAVGVGLASGATTAWFALKKKQAAKNAESWHQRCDLAVSRIESFIESKKAAS